MYDLIVVPVIIIVIVDDVQAMRSVSVSSSVRMGCRSTADQATSSSPTLTPTVSSNSPVRPGASSATL